MRSPCLPLRPVSRALFALGLLAVAVLSLLPAPEMPTLPKVWDKLEHFGAYAVLGLLGRFGLAAGWPAMLVGLAALGAGLEFAQAFVAGRSCAFGDMIANLIGAALGILLAALAQRRAPPRV
jgi:VanZ family protein